MPRNDRAAWLKSIGDELGAKPEVTLSDGTVADLLTGALAFDVAAAEKWQGAIGGALHHAIASKRYPGVVLLQTAGTEAERKAIERCEGVCRYAQTMLLVRESLDGECKVVYAPTPEERAGFDAVRRLAAKARRD